MIILDEDRANKISSKQHMISNTVQFIISTAGESDAGMV